MNGIDTGWFVCATVRAHARALAVITLALLPSLMSKPVAAAEKAENHESPALGSVDYVDYIVYSPTVESGEKAIEIRGWRQIDSNDELDGSGTRMWP